MHATTQEGQHTAAERLSLQVPKRDIDGRGGVGSDAAVIAVPPGLLLVLPPEGLGLHRVLADQVGRHAFDDRLGGEVGFRKLRDGFAPADLAVVGGDLGQAQVAKGVEVVRFGIADRNGFDLGDFHDAACP